MHNVEQENKPLTLSRLVFDPNGLDFKIVGLCGKDVITQLNNNKIKIYDIAYDFTQYDKMVHRVKHGMFKNYEIVGRGWCCKLNTQIKEFYTIDLMEPGVWRRLQNMLGFIN
jgi:hypothetical protein